MMSDPTLTRIVMANDLLNGDVIYWTSAQTWSSAPPDAALLTAGPEADAALARAKAQTNRAVDPTLVDLDGDRPVRLRDQIRHGGPTVGPHNTAPRGGADARYTAQPVSTEAA